MSPALRQHASRALRLLALCVLALGLLMKPVLVAACELDDLGRTQGSAEHPTTAAGESVEDPCCPGKVCGECCTSAAWVPVPAVAAVVSLLAADVPLPVSAGFVPAPVPVDIRPPIAV